MTTRAPGLTLVVVAYNEQENLERTVTEAVAVLRHITSDPELIIVDDGSTDRTGTVAEDLVRQLPWARALHHDRNMGMGAALKTGYKNAAQDFVTFLPADGQIPAQGVTTLWNKAMDTNADLVLSRYRRRRDGVHRWVLSKGLRLLTGIVAGTRIRSEGPYLVRKTLLEQICLHSDSFFVNLELPIRAARMGIHIEEVVLEVRTRQAGHTKVVSGRKIASVIKDLVALRLRMWRERHFSTPSEIDTKKQS